jgi:hypothetical protein
VTDRKVVCAAGSAPRLLPGRRIAGDPVAIARAGSPLPSGPVWVFPAVLAAVIALVLIPTRVVCRTTLRRVEVSDVEAV